MKLLMTVAALAIVASSVSAQVQVKGYTRSDGTYVNGYTRSSPDNSVTNNYSFKGNSNPYTGESGSNYNRTETSSPYYGTSGSSNSSNGNSGFAGQKFGY